MFVDMIIAVCIDLCTDLFIDLYIDMCIGICIDCLSTCVDMCEAMRVVMRVDTERARRMHMPVRICLDMYRCVYRQAGPACPNLFANSMCLYMCIDMTSI